MLKSGTEREAYPIRRAWAQPKLKEFLDAKGIYPQFVANCKAKSKSTFFPDHKKWNRTLNQAFSWAYSNEGHKFWSKLDDEFEQL